MIQELWFPTPIWYEHTSVNVEPIRSKCLELQLQGFDNRVKSNRGGWQSRDIFLHEFAEFNELVSQLQVSIDAVFKTINSESGWYLDNAWININQRGDHNVRHFHPNCTLSGTFYVGTDELSGKIKFFEHHLRDHYPIRPLNSNLFYNDVTYTPKNGMLVLFPSWLAHEVEPSNSNFDRISISFNVKQNVI